MKNINQNIIIITERRDSWVHKKCKQPVALLSERNRCGTCVSRKIPKTVRIDE